MLRQISIYVHAVAITPAEPLVPVALYALMLLRPGQGFVPAAAAFPVIQSGRLPRCPFRGLLSVHSRYGLHARRIALRRPSTPECFSHFVTSMTAPIATGWSEQLPGGNRTHRRSTPLHGALNAWAILVPSLRDLDTAGYPVNGYEQINWKVGEWDPAFFFPGRYEHLSQCTVSYDSIPRGQEGETSLRA